MSFNFLSLHSHVTSLSTFSLYFFTNFLSLLLRSSFYLFILTTFSLPTFSFYFFTLVCLSNFSVNFLYTFTLHFIPLSDFIFSPLFRSSMSLHFLSLLFPVYILATFSNFALSHHFPTPDSSPTLSIFSPHFFISLSLFTFSLYFLFLLSLHFSYSTLSLHFPTLLSFSIFYVLYDFLSPLLNGTFSLSTLYNSIFSIFLIQFVHVNYDNSIKLYLTKALEFSSTK